jgi:ABC-type uncharacterized transport system substrate-binding protein
VTDPLVSSNRVQINTLALNARLPTMHGGREYVEDGGLISYGPDISDMFRRAAEFADKILHGTEAGGNACPAADQVGIGDQFEDRKGVGPHGFTFNLSTCRRSD